MRTHAESEQISKTGGTPVFSAKPDALTNSPPTIKEPEIDIPSDLITKFGGADATNMAISSIGTMLTESGRFTLSYQTFPVPNYSCRITLNDLQIHQLGRNSGTGDGGFFSGFITNLLKVNVNGKPTKIDWSKDELQLSIRCAVSMNIIDSKTENVVAGGEGEVVRQDATKNINAELAGLTHNSSETNTVNFQSRLIQLASYYALTNMIPQIDRLELALSSAPKNSSAGDSKDSLGSVTERLKEIKNLLDQKLIDQDDYNKMKQKILQDASL